ncbi:MAG: hypothetical protein ACI4IE_00115 [Eubacterium sp.]
MKDKKAENLFQRKIFTDLEYAQKSYKKEQCILSVKIICTVLSIWPTVVMLLQKKITNRITADSFIDYLLAGIMILGYLATILCAYKFIFKLFGILISFGFSIVPFLLFDIIGAGIGFLIAIALVAFLPIVPCIISLIQTIINFIDAKKYLSNESIQNVSINRKDD